MTAAGWKPPLSMAFSLPVLESHTTAFVPVSWTSSPLSSNRVSAMTTPTSLENEWTSFLLAVSHRRMPSPAPMSIRPSGLKASPTTLRKKDPYFTSSPDEGRAHLNVETGANCQALVMRMKGDGIHRFQGKTREHFFDSVCVAELQAFSADCGQLRAVWREGQRGDTLSGKHRDIL